MLVGARFGRDKELLGMPIWIFCDGFGEQAPCLDGNGFVGGELSAMCFEKEVRSQFLEKAFVIVSPPCSHKAVHRNFIRNASVGGRRIVLLNDDSLAALGDSEVEPRLALRRKAILLPNGRKHQGRFSLVVELVVAMVLLKNDFAKIGMIHIFVPPYYLYERK